MQTKWFPKKDARFSKIKNILNLLCNDDEGEINENIILTISAIGRL